MSKSESNPIKSGIKKFIGLEHISAETFEFTGFGLVEDGTSFTKRFYKGNVLFSKRRSYLKKVAVADFDGICSGDILVFAVKDKFKDILLDDYLPYIVRSNDFIDYATLTSAGSLSPRTKWKEIAEYEFNLPSKEEQKEIVEALRYFNGISKNLHNGIKTLYDAMSTLEISMLNDSIT